MPPPSSKHQLKESEIATIRKWIEQGAKYQKHWSFEPIAPIPAPDAIANSRAWQSPIDIFLLQKMTEQGLVPSEPADKATLLRRLSFTLTGLPPTLEEADRFLNGSETDWYASAVDYYLKHPAFGEEMARHWLDVARYGDTHGLHLDNERNIWAYRDWVIQSFNQNLPFSDFTVQQLAGDLLPNPTTSSLIATGFLRCNVTTSEGGAINEEFLFRYAVDRASTTIQTWLGLTGGCAVCHEHKYDPLTKRDFYSIYALFNSNADPGMDGNVNHTSPYITLADGEQKTALEQKEALVESTKRSLERIAEEQSAKQHEDQTAKPELSEPASDSLKTTKRSPWALALLDDDFLTGASQNNTSRNPPVWTNRDELVPVSGSRSLMQKFGDKHNQKIRFGWVPVRVPYKASLRLSVRVDEHSPPKAVYVRLATDNGDRMWILANNDEDAATVGNAKRRIGKLPPAGEWQSIELSPDELPMPEGAKVHELELGLFGGICWWDQVVLSGELSDEISPGANVKNWIKHFSGNDPGTPDPFVNSTVKAGIDKWESNEKKSNVEAFHKAWVDYQPSPEIAQAREAFQNAKQDLESFKSKLGGSMVFQELPNSA